MQTIQKITLPTFSEADTTWKQFYFIFRMTLNPNLPFRVFKAYFYSQPPSSIDVSFIYKNGELIGFIEASFYRNVYNGKKITIGRGAAGILPNKSGKLPSFELCKKYMQYKWQNPWEEIYITGYMANPILYAMMCNYTHRVYPKAGIKPTANIEALKTSILAANNLLPTLQNEYLVKLHFTVQLSHEHITRIENSRQNKHMAHYLSINPNYGSTHGVFTIIPLDWLNIMASVCKGLAASIKKTKQRIQLFKASNPALPKAPEPVFR